MSPFAGGPDYPSVRIRSFSPWLVLAASLAYTLCLRLHALSADDRHSRSPTIAFCLGGDKSVTEKAQATRIIRESVRWCRSKSHHAGL